MKIQSLTLLAFIAVTTTARSQYVVTDPLSDTLSQINHVEDIAKYVEMVNNQVQQINALTQQLQQVTAYVKAFGDPASLLNIVGVDGLVTSLQNNGVGQTIGELQNLSDGVQALRYNANGLYSSVTDFSLSGTRVPRAADFYKKFSAINQTAQNYTTVYDDVFARRRALKSQMVRTTQSLQAATTAAETQKLSGVLAGQSAELAAIDKEIDFAASQASVQDIENRNDRERQTTARDEEMAADRQDAMKKMGATFVPDVKSDVLGSISK